MVITMKLFKRLISLMICLCIVCAPISTFIASATNLQSVENTPVTNWQAQWIWDNSNAGNTWMSFRKTVTLDTVPASVIVKIAVDSRYWLYINGKMVVFEGELKKGPTPKDTYFDSVDITKYLQQGQNTIAVKVWYWGSRSGTSYSSVIGSKGGFLFEGDFGGQFVISDSSWKVMKDPAYLNDTGSGQPNYRLPESNILYDARNEIAGWEQPGFDDSSWANATQLGAAGVAPWNQLYERSIPLLKDYGLKEYVNMDTYRNHITTSTETLAMKLPYNAQITPYLKIIAPAGLTIKLTTDNTGIGAVRSSYITKEGEQEFEALGWFNGETVNYQIPAGVTVVSLQYRESGYDTEFVGAFSSDDAFYNTLWQKAERTLYITMRDNFMDCPDRERGQWWGDVTNEMMEMMYALDQNAYLLYEKGLDTKIGFIDPKTKVLQTVVPINKDYFELPMQELAGVCGYWEYYLYTGKTEILEQMYNASKDYLNLWSMGSDGLVIHRPGSWDWPDWGSYADVPVLENAWYFKAMTSVKQMAEVLGKTSDIPAYDDRLASIKMNFNKFWTVNGYKSSAQALPDDRANAMAMLAGLTNESQYPVIRNVLTTTYNSSPYMEKYVLDALIEMGYMTDAQARMKYRYTPMVNYDYSTLWEVWDINGGTKNHAWSGGPLIDMSKYMAGVAPIMPGYDTYQIKPDMGTLNEIHASVPSIKGDIVLDITKNITAKTLNMKVVSPADTTAIVAVPRFNGDNTRVTFNGTVVFENGKATDSVEGVTYKSNDASYIYFNVAPGTWNIVGDVQPAGTASQYTLSIDATAGGKVLVGGEAVTLPYTSSVPSGTVVTIKAVADANSQFDSWSGSIGSTSQEIQVPVNNNTAINATFTPKAQKQYSIVSILNSDKSDIKVEYNGKQYNLPATLIAKNNETISLKAINANNGQYSFINWDGDLFSGKQTISMKVTGDINLDVNAAYCALQNLAKGAIVSASDSMQSGNTWRKENLTDGDINTGFTTNQILNVGIDGDISSHPHTITLNLGAAKSFDTVTIYPRTNATTKDGLTPNFPKEFTIQVSNDGTTFNDVKKVVLTDNPNGQPQIFDIGVQTAQYLRIVSTKLGPYAGDESIQDPYRIQLNEITLCNRSAQNIQRTLTINATGKGKVKINGVLKEFPVIETYPSGTELSIEAVADDSNFFSGWTGSVSSKDRPIYVALNQDVTLSASFVAINTALLKTNLALGKPVSTNSSYNGSGWNSAYLTDGKTDSTTTPKGYTSNPTATQIPSSPVYAEINLGQMTQLNQIILYPRSDVKTASGESANYPVTFKIQVKKQDGTYKDVYSVEEGANPKGVPQVYNFDAQTAQYIRIYVTKQGTPASGDNQYYVQLGEMEVYNDYLNPQNIALGAKVTAANSDGGLPSWGAPNLVDGILTSLGRNLTTGIKGYTSTGYGTNRDISANPNWIEIDLGSNSFVNHLELYPRTDVDANVKDSGITPNFPEDFTIQVKAEGETIYKTVYTATGITNQNGKPYICDFNKITARYVRIVTTKVGLPTWDEGGTLAGDSRVQLAEIRVGNIPSGEIKLGAINIDAQSTILCVGEQKSITATVEESSLANNSIYWTFEDENEFVSDIADVINPKSTTPIVIGQKVGTGYLVAHFANGLPTTAKVQISVELPGVKDILDAVIVYADSRYIDPSFQNVIQSVQDSFVAALNDAKVISANYATQDVVDNTWKTLLNEIQKLGFVQGDKTSLSVLISIANICNTNIDKYITTGKEEFIAALQNANDIINSKNAMQEDVDAAYTSLHNAMNGLVAKADKTSITNLITTADGYNTNIDDYVTSGKAEFIAALAAAKVVSDNVDAVQTDADAASTRLLNAMMALRFKADKATLVKVLSQASSIDTTLYTIASVSVFNTAKTNADAVYNEADPSAQSIENAVTTLQNAIKNLTVINVGTDTPSTTPNTTSSTPPSTSTTNPDTGTTTPVAGLVALVVAGAAVIFTRRRRSK
jgi:hypothetical protein